MHWRRRIVAGVLIMGFFGSLFGCSKPADGPRFVTEEAFRQNLAKQTKMSPMTVAQLRKHGVTDSTMLKLEFFFYTNAEAKAQGLAKALQTLGYDAKAGPSASDRRVMLVTGWTTAMKMDEGVVVAWTEKMCRLGFEHDCDFDGWGTNPQQ